VYRDIKWGLIITLAGFAWILAEWGLGLHSRHIDLHATVTLLWIPLAMVLLVLGLLDLRRARGGRLSYGQGLRAGLVIAVIVAVLSPLLQWLYLAVINPDFFPTMIDHAVSQGTEPAAARAYFTQANYLIQGTVGAFVGTLATAAVAMIFLRSRGTGANG